MKAALLALALLPATVTVVATAHAAAPGGAGHSLFNPVPADALREMATDRPNATNTPTTVDAGHLQIEAGAIDFVRDRQDGVRTREWSIGEVNLRLGVLDPLELNLVVQPRLISHERDLATGARERVRGFGDVTVGAKLNLWGNDGGDAPWSTGLAIQPQVKLPTAGNGTGNGHVEWAVNLPFQMTLPAGFNLSVQPSLLRRRNEDDTGNTTGCQAAVAVDHDLGPINAYAEYVASNTGDDPAERFLDLGGTAAVSDNLVLDVAVAIGANHAAADFEWTAGVSVRF